MIVYRNLVSLGTFLVYLVSFIMFAVFVSRQHLVRQSTSGKWGTGRKTSISMIHVLLNSYIKAEARNNIIDSVFSLLLWNTEDHHHRKYCIIPVCLDHSKYLEISQFC
jgi:hypothetical protein